MSGRCFFFAGGGTGGHIYPAVAVAERIVQLAPAAKVASVAKLAKVAGQSE